MYDNFYVQQEYLDNRVAIHAPKINCFLFGCYILVSLNEKPDI